MKKGQIRGVVLLAAVAGAAGFWWYQGQAAGPSAKSAEALVPVTTAVAARRDVPVYLDGLGSIQAYRSVSIHPQVDGLLLQATFTEGQQLRSGDLLAKIDPRSYQAALDQALAKKDEDEALLANARKDAERNAVLVDRNYVSPQVYDALRAKVAQLTATVKGDEAAIAAAKVQVGYTEIRSPIEGRAGIRQIDPGNIVHSESGGPGGSSGGSGSGGGPGGGGSDTLVVITQTHPISVIFTLSQDELPRLVANQARGPLEVTVFGRNGGDPLDQGQLQVIDNQVDPTTGMVRIKATLPNNRDFLWPGQFVNTRLLIDTRRQAVTVPAIALQRGAQDQLIFVVKDDGTVDSRKVVVGAIAGDQAEILQGVAEGETVVTAGQYRLHPGTKVVASSAVASAAKPE